jgi:hypothetical protein
MVEARRGMGRATNDGTFEAAEERRRGLVTRKQVEGREGSVSQELHECRRIQHDHAGEERHMNIDRVEVVRRQNRADIDGFVTVLMI